MNAKAPLLCVTLLLCLFSACATTPLITDLVVINYTQVGNTDQVNATTRLTDGMFLRYHFDSITDNDSHAQVFHFDPSKVFVLDQLAGQQVDASPAAHPCFPNNAVPVEVAPPGTTAGEELLGVTIRVHGNPASLQTQFFALNYHSGPNEHVVMATPNLTQGLPVPFVPNTCQHQ
jgi:hypothetical protein